jgi:hypothetical protein
MLWLITVSVAADAPLGPTVVALATIPPLPPPVRLPPTKACAAPVEHVAETGTGAAADDIDQREARGVAEREVETAPKPAVPVPPAAVQLVKTSCGATLPATIRGSNRRRDSTTASWRTSATP